MNTGFGFTEILVIITLGLVFFGSKELPGILREIAKFTAKMRRYSDRIKRELDDVARSAEPQPIPFEQQVAEKKKLRQTYLNERKQIIETERSEKSEKIMMHLLELDQIKNATMIMVYVNMGAEVHTRAFITQLLKMDKRIVVPYCIDVSREMKIAEIHDVEHDIVIGTMQVPEPRPELRTTVFKTDLQAIICPGVAFDPQGGRLGRGKGYYDSFLHELREKIPLIGIAYQCQIMQESLPFEYHDIAMDLVVTENGVVFRAPSIPNTSSPYAG